MTALHHAAVNGRVDCLNTLIARGAWLDLINRVRPAAAARPSHAPPRPRHRRVAADDETEGGDAAVFRSETAVRKAVVTRGRDARFRRENVVRVRGCAGTAPSRR